MSWIQGMAQRARELLRPHASELEIDEELRDHFEREVERRIPAGAAPDAARREARLHTGGHQSAKEAVRDGWTGRLLADVLSDVRTASATLAGLTPTRDLGAVRAEPNGDYVVTLSADPGVNVWNATSLFAPTKHRFLGLNYTTIDVQLDPATESVIINVDRGVRVGTSSSITVSGGPPEKVVLNLVGGGTLNTDGYVDPRILAPESTVIVRVNGSVSGGAYARRVDVRGGYAF